MPTPIDLNRFAQIKATGHLPSPRGVALEILRMSQDDSVSVSELAQTIKGDPAFVGRLIKAANGALFRKRAIVSVQEALMVVGISAVRALALGFSLLSNHRKGQCPGFDYMRFWSSSVIMAQTMQVLATRTNTAGPDDLFSVGLLARIGELALATVYPLKYGQVLAEAAAAGAKANLIEMEQQALSICHADLSAAMLMDWGIPEIFTHAVRYFERPLTAPFTENGREMMVTEELILSRCVADICLSNPEEQQTLMGKAIRLAAHLGCPREVFINDCNEIARQWHEWSKLLQLGDIEIPSFETLAGEESGEPSRAPLSPEGKGNNGNAVRQTEPARELRAMLVEGDSTLRGKLAMALKESGLQVIEHPGLENVMESILDIQPNMLVLGCGNSPSAVSRLIRTLRTSRLGRGIFILLLLPSGDEKYMAVVDAGADDFFNITAGTQVLLARLKAARRVIELQRELEHEREELRHFAAELAISNRSLQEAALTDALTGLPNRRYALDRMQQEWLAAHRSARLLACMVVDIDDFKQINDVYGHDVGDIALRLASESLRRVLRGQDVICRTGGDEFLVICPETSLEEALACGERLRKEIDRLTINNEDEVLHLSISVGVAVRDGSMPNVGELIKKADRAVLESKRRGRNQVYAELSPNRGGLAPGKGLKKKPERDR
ncbi:MAG: diguanylate cyclase [Azoarcus sp.]|jgi:diguanylate cyclase (GGDEF)-like protein|nr:diguanylate cyclase [Azoarcus sp.]